MSLTFKYLELDDDGDVESGQKIHVSFYGVNSC